MIIPQENIKTLRDITKSIKSYETLLALRGMCLSLLYSAWFTLLQALICYAILLKMRILQLRVHPPIKAIVLIYVFLASSST